MRHHRLSWGVWALSVVSLCLVGALATVPAAWSVEASGGRPIGAKVINIAGGVQVQVPGGVPRALRPGDYVYFGEDVTVHKGSSATLALSDRTLREFTGPTTLAVRQDVSPAGGTVLGNLTAGVADMLFSGKQRTSEVVMATRMANAGLDITASMPVLIHPAPGENLVDVPKQFRWRGIEGVPLYRVSVYSASQMMWQGTTSETKASCPPKTCEFRPGEAYYWVVEALVGNTTLRSRAAEFTVLAADVRSGLAKALSDADASVSDPAAAAALKARLCLDGGAYAKALEVLDQAVAGSPSRTAYMLRAEVKDAMGLPEDALGDYRAAIALPPVE